MAGYNLGKWDLSELADAANSSAFRKQVAELEDAAKKFERKKGKLEPNMSAKKFSLTLHELEKISEKMGKIGGYASLAYAADTQSDEATSVMTKMSKLGSEISNKILFFDVWWKTRIDEKNAKRLIRESGELSEYLAHKRLVAKYSLSEPIQPYVTLINSLVSIISRQAYETKENTVEGLLNIINNSKS